MVELNIQGAEYVFPREDQHIDRELYRLLTIFAGSSTLSEKRDSERPEGEKSLAAVYEWTIQSFEYPEIGRLLLSLAALARNDWDCNPGLVDSKLNDSTIAVPNVVGELIEDQDVPDEVVQLDLRESLNKILHANRINLDRSEGSSIDSGHLHPFVHFYGTWREAHWKATLDVYRWAEVMHCVFG